MIANGLSPSQEIKSLLPFFPTRLVLRVSDKKDSKLLLKSEAAFWELNVSGKMFFFHDGKTERII